jgi:hypothetical protein
MLALELSAVLAVVVTQTPLKAFISHTGGLGVVGGGGVYVTSVGFLQEPKASAAINTGIMIVLIVP